jgi:single-stranded DNA-binding protein
MSAIESAFLGTIVRDVETRTSKSGREYLKFSVRVGEGDTAQFVGVMLFGDDVPELADKLSKGCRIYVEGKLSLDEWAAQDGTKRHGLNVMSWHARLPQIGKNKNRRDDAGTAQHGTHAPLRDDFDDPIPF